MNAIQAIAAINNTAVDAIDLFEPNQYADIFFHKAALVGQLGGMSYILNNSEWADEYKLVLRNVGECGYRLITVPYAEGCETEIDTATYDADNVIAIDIWNATWEFCYLLSCGMKLKAGSTFRQYFLATHHCELYEDDLNQDKSRLLRCLKREGKEVHEYLKEHFGWAMAEFKGLENPEALYSNLLNKLTANEKGDFSVSVTAKYINSFDKPKTAPAARPTTTKETTMKLRDIFEFAGTDAQLKALVDKSKTVPYLMGKVWAYGRTAPNQLHGIGIFWGECEPTLQMYDCGFDWEQSLDSSESLLPHYSNDDRALSCVAGPAWQIFWLAQYGATLKVKFSQLWEQSKTFKSEATALKAIDTQLSLKQLFELAVAGYTNWGGENPALKMTQLCGRKMPTWDWDKDTCNEFVAGKQCFTLSFDFDNDGYGSWKPEQHGFKQ